MQRISYLIQELKSSGIRRTVNEFITGYFTVNHFIVLYRNLKKPVNSEFKRKEIEMRKISLSELQSLRKDMPDLPMQFYCDEIYNFSTPFIAFIDGKLAAIHWVVLPGETSRFLNMKEGDVELNYNTVLPQYRGSRVAGELIMYIIKSYTDSDSKRMFGICNVLNIPIWKQAQNAGFEPVEILTHFGFYRPKATLEYAKL